jgi:hypothetical protein
MGEVIPKLPSTLLLFQTLFVLVVEGYAPLSVAAAVAHTAVEGQTGGSACPLMMVVASPAYTLRESTRFPAVNPENELVWPYAAAHKSDAAVSWERVEQ